ncbi:ATP-dependent exoDNAse (exonuclease V), alpha subunit - helicase superfamily I member [Moorella thermoacetica Y72]|uniref:ATP-dependent exoDNAse (Exonuclease V), alpha subunit-helicase superfamily I member n=1 Tax=Moorella thermoacetica Y72 TaxID=1325331 RepID=A0A0S6UC95_NEOTH|nr:ATP-dependent exoDNAse (exonuclease V), alpha subunit - helicase superfamily I member [Moorella thermoacetica Y72]
MHPPGFPAGQVQITLAYPPVKLQIFLFQSVAAARVPAQADCHRNINEKGYIRPQVTGGQVVEPLYQFCSQLAAVPLVGQGGIAEAIAQDDLARRQGRANPLRYMLGPGGGVEEKLRPGINRAIRRLQEQPADGLRKQRPARFPGPFHCQPPPVQVFFQPIHLGSFTGTVRPLQGYKKASAHISITCRPRIKFIITTSISFVPASTPVTAHPAGLAIHYQHPARRSP